MPPVLLAMIVCTTAVSGMTLLVLRKELAKNREERAEFIKLIRDIVIHKERESNI